MTKRRLLNTILAAVTLAVVTDQAVLCQQNDITKADCPRRSIYRRWLDIDIISSSIEGNQTVVEVLLPSQTYSECSLRDILNVISEKYAKAERLQVRVSRVLGEFNSPDGVWALYVRESEVEGIRYRPSASYKGTKVVVLRGKNPFEERR